MDETPVPGIAQETFDRLSQDKIKKFRDRIHGLGSEREAIDP